MLIGDATGIVAVVFSDDKADHIVASKVGRGKIIRVLHGYSRERQGTGEIEINVGNRGTVYMEPLDVTDSEFPKMDSFFKSPGQVSSTGPVNLEGVIMGRSPPSTFNRKDGTEGKVARLTIEEGGRQITAVLWDEKVGLHAVGFPYCGANHPGSTSGTIPNNLWYPAMGTASE